MLPERSAFSRRCRPVGEVCLATPAIAGDLFLVRGKSHLYAFAEN